MATKQLSNGNQHVWHKPEGTDVPKLKVYNSLTRNKDEFIPLQGRRVLWYSCGPTVYDASHMGHARSYITFDILRRVMSDYFGYEILYVMNITDIDDKIIKRARRNHLLSDYATKDYPLSDVMEHVVEALKPFKEKTEKEMDEDKKKMMQNTLSKVEDALLHAREGTADVQSTKVNLIEASSDALSAWLDAKYGSEVCDHSIFAALTTHWEEEFHKDMEALNVLPPDVLTRVSEYIPEVVEFVQGIITKGYAYESHGSVYFNVTKYAASPDHSYAKLVPEAVGDLQALAEGEGELSVSAERLQEKQSEKDFALWKASKPGEPAWPSPWGSGRPGWHIECSVMACDILGQTADIHTGGVDLKFPHHDNEIAQVEACFGHDQWISYFLHSGHLIIEGCKMSKSLKNFITIKEALQRYSARQLRIAFLLHAWNVTLDYSEQTMVEALYIEKIFNEFFQTVKDLVRKQPSRIVESWKKFQPREKQLNTKFLNIKSAVHEALCNSIDTPTVLQLMREMVTACNIYLAEAAHEANARLLQTIALYLTHLFQVFGVVATDNSIGFPLQQEGTVNQESVVMPYVTALADFREEVRKIALEENNKPLLGVCDKLRNETLVDLGVRLEDKDGTSVVKLVGKEAILREKEQEKQLQEEKVKQKEHHKKKLEEAKRHHEAQAAIPPEELFRSQMGMYSMFDKQGLPTHDAEGQPLSVTQKKKLKKLLEAQEKKYKDYLAKSKIDNY